MRTLLFFVVCFVAVKYNIIIPPLSYWGVFWLMVFLDISPEVRNWVDKFKKER